MVIQSTDLINFCHIASYKLFQKMKYIYIYIYDLEKWKNNHIFGVISQVTAILKILKVQEAKLTEKRKKKTKYKNYLEHFKSI